MSDLASPEDRLWLAILLRSDEFDNASDERVTESLRNQGFPDHLITEYLRRRAVNTRTR